MLRASVALFAFNRPETTARVFETVRAARPARLFLVCDGPRADRAGEAERCAEVRRLLDGVDWPCDVERNYADANLGCRERISSGIAWVFSRTEEAIFLEDDTLPDASFFPYCDELLARFRDDARVLSISGYCPQGESPIGHDSYWFSAYPRIWGWAGWRRSWAGYDAPMSSWPAFRASESWRGRTAVEREVFGPWFDAVHAGTNDTWDAQFVLLGLQSSALTVIPRRNLVTNIGFGVDATHTMGLPLYFSRQSWTAEFPLVHPSQVRPRADLDDAILRAEHAVRGTALTRAVMRQLRRAWHCMPARPRATLSFYEWRATRWARVVGEWRPGTVAPAPGPRRVLVVRLDAIGDFALWTGAARALRAWLGPETHVTLAANELWADLARDATIADDVWPIARGRLEHDGRYRAEWRARVRGAGFSLVINPRFTREMMLGDSLVRWSGAAERVGDVGEDLLLPPRDRRRADAWYTRLVATPSPVMHETERHAAFLRGLGVPLDGVPRPELTVSPADVPSQAVATGARPGAFFVVFPGASLPEKRWDAQHFAAVAREICARTGWQALVLGAEDDIPLARAITAVVPGALNLAGRTSVAALAATIGQSRLVVTSDTAAVHLAAATGVRAICVSGGWHWRRFVPYPASLGAIASRVHTVSSVDEMPCFGCGGYCSLPHRAGEPLPCVERVSVARVLATVSHVLSLPDMQSDG